MLRSLAALRAALPVGVFMALGVGGGCSPSNGSGAVDGGNGGASSGGASANGGTSVITGGGGTGGAVVGGASGAAQGGSGAECALSRAQAMPVPVDVYVMLDLSGSMVQATGASATSKWDAVKGALTTFFNDQSLAGLNMSAAIQYFPLQAPGVPASCTASSECGDRGPCLLRACALYIEQGFAQCETDNECMNALVKDDGPCEAGTCRLSGAACADAAACQTYAPNVGPCIGLGRCANDQGLLCEAGTLCGPNNMCNPVPSGVCVKETLCDQTSYETPAVEFSPLPAAAATLAASIEAQTPRGETPTRPALRGAIDHARAWTATNPGHSAVVVLATDGLPTDCSAGNALHPTSASELAEVAAVAAEGFSGTPSVPIFVIGVFAGTDTQAPANLNQIAMAGGTTAAFMVDASGTNVNADFVARLREISRGRLPCEYQIPPPPSGMTFDPGLVNVDLLDPASMPSASLARVAGGLSRCEEVGGGWYYDVEPPATPTKIIACPSTCEAIRSAPEGSQVSIALGCTTIVR